MCILRRYRLEIGDDDTGKPMFSFGELFEMVRGASKPCALIIDTCRFGPHSKGDDTRPADDIDRLRLERDPVTIHGTRIELAVRQSICTEVESEISQAYQQALDDPYPQTAENDDLPR